MTLRGKLSLFSIVFLIAVGAIGAFAFHTVDVVARDIEHMDTAITNHNDTEELDNSLLNLFIAVEQWAHTGNTAERREFHYALSRVYKAFGAISSIKGISTSGIGKEFDEARDIAQEIIAEDNPVGNRRVLKNLSELEERQRSLSLDISKLRKDTLAETIQAIKLGKTVRQDIGVSFIIAFSSFFALTIILNSILSRTIASPISKLAQAAENIGKGDLTYRIGIKRSDELGLLSRNFDVMAEAIEASHRRLTEKLTESEIILEVSGIANSTLNLTEIFKRITGVIAKKFNRDVCEIYLYNEVKQNLCLVASNGAGRDTEGECFPAKGSILGISASGHRPLSIEDITTDEQYKNYPDAVQNFKSLLSVPILRDDRCLGLIVIRTILPNHYTADEIDILKIISHNLSSAIKNAELYENTLKQFERIASIYEMTKALTSLLNLDELLSRIAEEAAKLLRAKGCMIRFLEGDELIIKASYGIPKEMERQMTVKLGESIPGWVAQKRSPLLIEDMAEMPAEMRTPNLEVTSVICVPLKIGERVIGTIGLYDKMEGEAFDEDDLNTVNALASTASIAIENARLYEDLSRREAEAIEAKRRLEILFESVQGGIITFDRGFRIVFANRFIEELIGKRLDDILGKDCSEIFNNEGIQLQEMVRLTFDNAKSHSQTQKYIKDGSTSHIQISTYPLRDATGGITEVIAFIQDITERIMYQDEIFDLYKEVAQTKEYLEGIIDNSADAIVTSDINGVITSWNRAAEIIYGFTEQEALTRFLPMVSSHLIEIEKGYIERLKKGEIIRDMETVRQRKDGSIIEVSLTLSPILNPAGEVIGISGISRDISEKKRVQKELVRRNLELSRLSFISSAVRSTFEVDRLLRMILTAVTMSDGLGFNRALLFLVDEEGKYLRGVMGVGPASPDEAWKIWEGLSIEKKGLEDLMREIETGPLKKDSFLDRLSQNIQIRLDGDSILSRIVKEKKAVNIANAKFDPVVDPILIQQLGTEAFAAVPLIAKDRVVGIIWVDNLFNRRPITDDDLRFLVSFANHVSSAIESAQLFKKVSLAEAELENIFESISDIVYFTDKNYVLKKINRAVSETVGKPYEDIIGKKCYEVFHGKTGPWHECPHWKTVDTGKSYIEEVKGFYYKTDDVYVVSSSPIYDTAGNFIGTVHIARDITELNRLKEQLARSEKMAALGGMAARVAHEIRNPLTPIGGFARRLAKRLAGEQKEYAEIIVREVDRLEAMLDETLSFVRQARLSIEPFDINSLLDSIISLITPSLKSGVEVRKDPSPEPLLITGDTNRLKEAFLNIIKNAEQAITEKGVITIRSTKDVGAAVVEISDTGSGIDEEALKFIFDPFFTTKASGTGLGLAITNRIIEEHGGRIGVESEKDKGTTFRVYLPLRKEE